MEPIVKWPGGKWAVINSYIYDLLPIAVRIPDWGGTYYEPFVGGGALFFYIEPARAVISDTNESLIAMYKSVAENVDRVIEFLEHLKQMHSESFYYEMRRAYNIQVQARKFDAFHAALFIYLNHTCYNGLYRVNKLGAFNVPLGRYETPNILNTSRLRKASALLNQATIATRSFECVVENVHSEDFVYFDPPYIPISKTSDFTAYTKQKFSDADHENLASVFKQLDKQGCYVLLTNSDTPLVRSLYDGFSIQKIATRRPINCKAENRSSTADLIIRNFDAKTEGQ